MLLWQFYSQLPTMFSFVIVIIVFSVDAMYFEQQLFRGSAGTQKTATSHPRRSGSGDPLGEYSRTTAVLAELPSGLISRSPCPS